MSEQSSSPIETQNAHGWTNDRPNELSEEFIAFAASVKGVCLDVGAAYGVAAITAARAGATVIANDSDDRHLRGLWERAGEEERSRLLLRHARFPDNLHIEAASLVAVHASNVFHFLRGYEIEAGLACIARWLRPGGRLFLLACTPWVGNLRELIPRFEARRRAGVRWPGECDDVHAYLTHPTAEQIPAFLNPLTRDVLVPAVESVGLRVDSVRQLTRRDIPDFARYDGRENLALVATRQGWNSPKGTNLGW